jgi:TM2 domain-containing membrane protein YozV
MERFPRRSVYWAYMLWLLSGCGWLAMHRIYLGKYKTVAVWTITFGLCGIGALIDLFTLPWLVKRYNTIQELKTVRYQLTLLEEEKETFVKSQRFEEAASCRNKERLLEKQLQDLKKTLKRQ